MKNTYNACSKNSAIAAEWGKLGRLKDKRDEATGYGGPRKAAGQQTLQAREAERKYTSRKNICGTCFTARSVTGTCGCED